MKAALDRISKAKKANSVSLDLSGLGLVTLPRELFELTHLQSLVLGRYRTPQRNHLKSIPKEIAQLKNLQVLDLTDNLIAELPIEVFGLQKLKKLVLSSNQFQSIPEEISNLTKLQDLFLGNNRISKLPASFAKLQSLTGLRINNNRFTKFPEEINQLPHLEHLYVFGNPISGVPKELLGLSTKDNVCHVVKQWFRDQVSGESYIYEAKLILVGEAEAGKTSLSEKLRNPNFELNPTQPMTKGIEVNRWSFPFDANNSFRANIWDFGGQEIMHATHRYFLTERSLYVLVVDIRAEKTDLHYWLGIIEMFSAKSPVIIVLNEKHGYRKSLPIAVLDRYKDTIVGTYNVNLKNNEGLQQLRDAIQARLKSLPHVGVLKIPDIWLAIRKNLEARTEETISIKEYVKLALSLGVADEEQALLIARILHELGTILYFHTDNILRETMILNKTWATEAVYLVLLDRKVAKNNGRFTFQDVDRIWKDYLSEKRTELLQLMKKFLLCYEIAGDSREYIIPQLLPENPPTLDYLQAFGKDEIYFRYSYPKFMPKGLISQLITKVHQKYIHDNIQWKTGLVMKIEDAFVEVTEDFFDRRINIKAVGSNKRNAITIIRSEIREINDNFEKLEEIEEIPCGCQWDSDNKRPSFVSRKSLELFKEGGELHFKCQVCLKKLTVLELLDNVIGDEDYVDQLKAKPDTIYDDAYIETLMNHESNEVEFKATFLVPVYSKADKAELEKIKNQLKIAEDQKNESMKNGLEKKRNEIHERLKSPKTKEEVIHSTIKTLCAFANSNGGELVIGIDENPDNSPYIFGIEKDLQEMNGSKDELIRKFDELISKAIGNSFWATTKQYWIPIKNKQVLLIRVEKSQTEVFCKKEQKELFYIRREGSTVQLEGKEMLTYCKNRF